VGHSLPQVLQRRSEEAWAVSATADPGRESFTLENGLPSALGIPVVSSLPRNGVFVFVVATVSLLFLRCTFAKSRNFKRRQPQDRELPSRLRATRPQLSRAKDRRQYLQRKLKSGAIPRVGRHVHFQGCDPPPLGGITVAYPSTSEVTTLRDDPTTTRSGLCPIGSDPGPPPPGPPAARSNEVLKVIGTPSTGLGGVESTTRRVTE